ncbi:hypothetical protein CBM2633_B10128 [Cupriavidus taiwanensis]|nr:hypothetical protein CBM2614_B180128 [Cupriavidus taiwanensis]SOZ65673.1 hypothetical protein CBM2615_B170130 [Cupriavidus taiwanensis]SPA17631.1 hypothetical protein CBM2633_B10128 [Cupriavidus taiwanensis]
MRALQASSRRARRAAGQGSVRRLLLGRYCLGAGSGESPLGPLGASAVGAAGAPCSRGFLLRAVFEALSDLDLDFFMVSLAPGAEAEPMSVAAGWLREAGGEPSIGGTLGFGAFGDAGAC